MKVVPRACAAGVIVVLVCSGAADSFGEGPSVTVDSAVLRNRVIVTDRVFMKKALYVAFSVAVERNSRLQARGRLSNNRVQLAEASVTLSEERSGNLVFDLPFEIPGGSYDISVDVLDAKGRRVASGSRTFDRSRLRSTIVDAPEPPEPALEVVESRPSRPERVDRLSARAVRNGSVTLTFSVEPLHPVGNVAIVVSDLSTGRQTLSKNRVQVACVEAVPDAAGMPRGKFRALPTLLRPLNAKTGDCRRVWIKIRVDGDVAPGVYSGKVTLAPERGASTSLPLELNVAPISLEEIPGVDYCMLMTYEFTELAMPWRDEQRRQLYAAAGRILKNYREHGMTTLCLHSPFVLMTKSDGAPDLDDIFAALRAARDAGFTRPVVWYMGHLIQTAKPRHPGNIRGFNEDVQIPRLRYLVRTVSKFAKNNGLPEVVFLPIDEPDDSYQDIEGRRAAITPLLVKTIREAGGRSMVTAEGYLRSGKPDILASASMSVEELRAAHAGGSRYWRYENRVTMECTSPAYARYQYGYYTWKSGIDGMSTWTFQNTQNAAGPPGQANPPSAGRDVYLAYPAAAGPLSTLRWEAIAAGIDDYKLVYQLMKRVAKLKAAGKSAKPYEDFLADMRAEVSEPSCDADVDGSAAFDRRRDALIDAIQRADAELR